MTRGTVCLVPGFGGSELVYHTGRFDVFGPQILWIAYDRLLFYFERLDWSSGWLVPRNAISSYYGPLVQRLWDRGWRVVAPRVDWRGDVAGDAPVVADLVRGEYLRDGRPVHMLGHSRGGLVIRRALAILAAAGQLDHVGRCVGMGVPHRGTLSPATLLGQVNDTLLAVYTWQRAIQLGIERGDWPRRVSRTIASWPGLYGLLPDDGHPWLTLADLDRVYTCSSYLPWNCNQGLSMAGRRSWAGTPDLPAGVQWLDIVGSGVSTPNGLGPTGDLSSADTYRWSTDGDGTVWLRSWVGWPDPGLVLAGVGHERIPQDGRAIDAADVFFRG